MTLQGNQKLRQRLQYYLGAIVGCFVGGWAADRIGRINGLFFAAMFALVGGALQAATQSADFILVARVVTGLGTGGKHWILCSDDISSNQSAPQLSPVSLLYSSRKSPAQNIVVASLDTSSSRTTSESQSPIGSTLVFPL